MSGVEVFVAMRTAWRSRVPKSLADEDPALLLRLLQLAGAEDGLSQTALQEALKIRQPKMSKLKAKLIREKLVRTWKPDSDRRKLMMTSTANGKGLSVELRTQLAALFEKAVRKPQRRPSRRGLVPPSGPSLLSDLLPEL